LSPGSSRRGVMAALATATVAVVLAVTVSGRGCRPGDASPEGAVRAFVAAARVGDKRGAWDLLGPATRQRLEQAARGATERAGGVRRYQPLDMLGLTASEGGYAQVNVSVRERHGDRAVVDVVGPGGQRDSLQVVRVKGRWRVELETE
jgi:hypothetical protein